MDQSNLTHLNFIYSNSTISQSIGYCGYLKLPKILRKYKLSFWGSKILVTQKMQKTDQSMEQLVCKGQVQLSLIQSAAFVIFSTLQTLTTH
jgi:hypothetical protein